MKTRYRSIALALGLLLPAIASCEDAGAKGDWEQILNQRLSLYGHRNWIVVADSAYPYQSRDGIETVIANADQITVLQRVLGQISNSKHVRADIYTDSELGSVTNSDAPGISAFRQSLAKILAGQTATSIIHEQIISKLDQAAQVFHILIIKTNSTLPYTTVFVQLKAAYWGDEQEQRLRTNMATHPK